MRVTGAESRVFDDPRAAQARARARRERVARQEALPPPPGLLRFLASLLVTWIAGEIRLAIRSLRARQGRSTRGRRLTLIAGGR
jgi:hypothetical protein